MTAHTSVNLLSPKVLAIAATAIVAGSLAACGSSPSSTSAGSTSATPTSAALTPAAPTSAAATGATPTSAAPASAASAIAVTVPAWCISPRPVIAPGSLAAWLGTRGGYGYAREIQLGLVNLRAASTAATFVVESSSLCQDVGFAKYSPPPVDVTGYTRALKDALKAAVILHDGSGQPTAQAAASPYIRAATTAIDAFLAAVGRPVG